MTSPERVRAAMEGRASDVPPVAPYISWPEYGWRFTGHPIWEVVLGDIDGIDAMERVLARHPSDIVGGPIGRMGTGWLRGKRVEQLDERAAWFAADDSSRRRWRFDLESHVLVELDAGGGVVEPARHAGSADAGEDTPATVAEAESWFRRRYDGGSAAPAGRPEDDRAAARWRGKLFLVTSTLAPFVAVAYAFGYERSMVLLAEHPRVFARLQELFIQRFSEHFAWAARAGYDGGHMVDSWSGADTIAPATFRDWVAPFLRDAARMIHAHGLKADLYLPGETTPILPFLRGHGWDALRMDDLCRGRELDIGVARRLLGPEQCLFGNMSSYALLAGDHRDIELRARRQREDAGSEGRLIVSNGSGICDRTRPEVIDVWLDFARL